MGLAPLLGLVLGLVVRRTQLLKCLTPHMLPDSKGSYRILPWWKAPRSIAAPGIAIAIMAVLFWPGRRVPRWNIHSGCRQLKCWRHWSHGPGEQRRDR
jgi:hypothetical protein